VSSHPHVVSGLESHDADSIEASKWARRVGFMGKIMWQPFDVRFKALLTRLGDHRIIFDQEIAIQDQMMLNQIQKSLQDVHIQSDKTLQTAACDTASAVKQVLNNLTEGQRTTAEQYSILSKSLDASQLAKLREDLDAAQQTLRDHYAAIQKSIEESSQRQTQVSEDDARAQEALRAGTHHQVCRNGFSG
jgi:hypothetical protein